MISSCLHLQRVHECCDLRISDEIRVAKRHSWKFNFADRAEVCVNINSRWIGLVTH